MANVFEIAPENENAFKDAPIASPPSNNSFFGRMSDALVEAPVDDPAAVAQRLGIPGAERLTQEPTGMEAFTSPFVALPKPQTEADDAALTRFSKGFSETAIGIVEGLESPLGVSMLAASALPVVGKTIGRTAAAGFGVHSVLDGFKEAASAYQKGDMTEAGRAVGKLLLGSAMVRGSVAGLPSAPRTTEALSKSADALKQIEENSTASKAVESVRPSLDISSMEDAAVKAIGEQKEVANGVFTGEAIDKILKLPPGTAKQPLIDLGILNQTPEGYEFSARIQKLATRPSGIEVESVTQSLPPAVADTASVPYLASFLPHAEAKQVFSQPFGAANIPIIGRVLDPHAKMTIGPLPEALAAFHAEKFGVAPAAAANVGLRLKAKGIDEAFPVDPKTGELTTVQPRQPGQSLAPGDIMEALQRDPASYDLSPAQRTAFGELEKWRKEVEAQEQKHGITPEEIAADEGDTGYFPRIVIKRPETDVAPLAGGGKVGAKQFFQKERMFETEREGVARGFQYEPSLEARATTRTERSYRAIADKRLANDPALGSRTRSQVEAEIREAHSEEIGAGTMTESKLQQIVDSVERKGSVWGQSGFAGKIFDPETANTLNKAFPAADSAFRHTFVKVNNALKAMRLSADVGVPLLQGLPTLFRNPSLWGKGVWNSFKAMLDEKVMARYAEQNTVLINELATYGSGVGRLPEMLAGLEKGNFVERLPIAGPVFKATGRQFETFLDVAKVELWKSWRELTPEAERLQVIRTIESQLSMGRMESIGVSRNRALAERALFLAPSYYRGAINLIGAMGEKGVSGKIARQSIGAYAAGGTATFLGLAYALGMDEEEIMERLNPADKNFHMWDVEVDGKRLNVGFGGIHRSLLRLAANMTVTSIEHPGNWLSLTSSKNPLARWYRGHAASVPGITWDAITGRDFLAADSDLTTLWQSVVPLAAQPSGPVIKDIYKDREPELAPAAVETGASLIGLPAYPERRRR